MAKVLAIFTSCRGDIGILTPLVKNIYNTKKIKVLFFVGGTHLSKKYGYTIDEIKKSKIKITETYNYHIDSDDPYYLSKSTNKSGILLADIFRDYNFDYVCILGDRFERIPIILNALLFKKAIVHLHGGEKTEGLIDEQVRNMISKSAHIHFVICKQYMKNLNKIGEKKWRIFNSGSLALDNIKNIKKINYKKILYNYKINPDKPFCILTYHPVTLEFDISLKKQIKNIFQVIKKFDFQVIITHPGNEVGSHEIINLIKNEVIKSNNNFFLIKSLGYSNLYNLIPHSNFVIGNSSFGIIEVPYFKIPTINIGDRQKGRYMHESIINCDYSSASIEKAILKTKNEKFVSKLKKMKYEFGNGNASKKIIDTLYKIKINQKLLRKVL